MLISSVHELQVGNYAQLERLTPLLTYVSGSSVTCEAQVHNLICCFTQRMAYHAVLGR